MIGPEEHDRIIGKIMLLELFQYVSYPVIDLGYRVVEERHSFPTKCCVRYKNRKRRFGRIMRFRLLQQIRTLKPNLLRRHLESTGMRFPKAEDSEERFVFGALLPEIFRFEVLRPFIRVDIGVDIHI